jgi:hypothetical protein
MYPPDEEGFNASSVARTLFLESVDRSVAQLIVDRIQSSSAMLAVTQLRVLGGAVARVPAEATAYAHRTRRIMGNVAALYTNPEETPEHESWATEFAAALRQGEPGAYVNFVGNEGEERVRHAYPGATWDRLAAVKAKYDPTNLFRLNQNIKPAS